MDRCNPENQNQNSVKIDELLGKAQQNERMGKSLEQKLRKMPIKINRNKLPSDFFSHTEVVMSKKRLGELPQISEHVLKAESNGEQQSPQEERKSLEKTSFFGFMSEEEARNNLKGSSSFRSNHGKRKFQSRQELKRDIEVYYRKYTPAHNSQPLEQIQNLDELDSLHFLASKKNSPRINSDTSRRNPAPGSTLKGDLLKSNAPPLLTDRHHLKLLNNPNLAKRKLPLVADLYRRDSLGMKNTQMKSNELFKDTNPLFNFTFKARSNFS